MDKKPEVDGAWLECDFETVIGNKEALNKAVCVAVSCPRIEISGEELDRFRAKLLATSQAVSGETAGMTPEQASYYILRKMLVG